MGGKTNLTAKQGNLAESIDRAIPLLTECSLSWAAVSTEISQATLLRDSEEIFFFIPSILNSSSLELYVITPT